MVKIIRELSNIPGWTTDRKLVVLESDDWGSIRMPSVKVFEKLTGEGIDLVSDEGSRYNLYDTLAEKKDLEGLFEVLNSVRDSTGRPVVITPVSVVANPDFKKIKESGFKEYHFEPITATLKRYYGREEPFLLWREGIRTRLFMPQFHGREHLNVKVWMRALQRGHPKIRKAFDNGMWGISTSDDPETGLELQAAFDFISPEDIEYHKQVISTGLDLFERLFGYRASYFVPPNGPFSNSLEQVCLNNGIKYMSGSKIQREPVGGGKTRVKFHWLGQKSLRGLTYLTRNCFFEPGQHGADWVDRCLSDVDIAFKWRKPAIICSHRVNFIGALYTENRINGLTALKKLLKEIVRKWPEAEFITSAELGELISYE